MDYKSIEDLFKKMDNDQKLFLDYLREYSSNSKYSLLDDYAKSFRHFKKLVSPLKHLLGLTVLDNLVIDNRQGAKKMRNQFKSEFKTEIDDEVNSFNCLSEYLLNKSSCDISKLERIFLVNFDDTGLSKKEVVEKVRELAFPELMRNSREFVNKFRETLADMIYLDYKAGHRETLVSFDEKENHFLAEWVLRKRSYDFLSSFNYDVDTLAYRMWQILGEKSKQGLFD